MECDQGWPVPKAESCKQMGWWKEEGPDCSQRSTREGLAQVEQQEEISLNFSFKCPTDFDPAILLLKFILILAEV